MLALGELATLASTAVDGFERPFHKCARCNGRGEFFHDVFHEDVTCARCGGAKGSFNNDPAALAMAVWLYARKTSGGVEMDGSSVAVFVVRQARGVSRLLRKGGAEMADVSEESIARAFLVALLRAHGVEVKGE